jgi:hypothetical protein
MAAPFENLVQVVQPCVIGMHPGCEEARSVTPFGEEVVGFFQELGSARLAFVDVVFDPPERDAQLRQQQPDLVSVPRGQVIVQDRGASPTS